MASSNPPILGDARERPPTAPAAPPELVELARGHLGKASEVYFAPAIPPDKEVRVRATHEAHLPATEPILVLYDGTLFGSAENGFVLTPERLCWKNLLEHPRQIPWSDLDPAGVVPEDGRIGVAGGGIQASSELVPGAARLIVAMAKRWVPPDASPYRENAGPPPDAGELPVARLVALSRAHVGGVEAIFHHPEIPERKLSNARAVHAAHLRPDEPVAVLYDDTVFGGAKDGFLITPRQLCWKNLVDEPEAVAWSMIPPEHVTASGNVVRMMGWTVRLTGAPELATRVAGLFAAIIREARGGSGAR